MLQRIGDAAQSSRMTTQLIATQARVHTAQTQIASGKTAQRYDEISRDASLLLSSEDLRTRLDQHVKGSQIVVDRLMVMDGTLSGLGDLAEQFRAILIQRLNDPIGQSLPLDAQADEMLEQAANLLNVQLDNRYLFSGSRTDTAPVALPATPITIADPTLYYQGDQLTMSARLGDGLELDYGMTADRTGFAQLIAAFGDAAQGHIANDVVQIEDALDHVNRAIDELSSSRGKLGAVMKRAESTADIHRASILYLDETISRIEDTDIAAAMARLATDRVQLEGSYAVIAQLSRLSLADYLR